MGTTQNPRVVTKTLKLKTFEIQQIQKEAFSELLLSDKAETSEK